MLIADDETDDLNCLYHKADIALYEAKKSRTQPICVLQRQRTIRGRIQDLL